MMDKKKGFTLIEVLGVIIILAIVASIGLFIYSNVTDESKVIVNSVTKQSIEEAALSYVKEFKLLEDRFWYDKENSTTGEKFTCTTIKQLVNTGYLPNNPVDATTGEKYKDDTTIMVERDANMVLKTGVTIDAIECDNSPPKVEITFTGTNVTDSKGTVWYNNENDATVTIKPIVGIAGVAEYEYIIIDSKGNKATIESGNEKKEYKGKIIDIIGTYNNNYGKNVRVCAKIKNVNDLEIEGNYGENKEFYCESVNLDFTKPTAPVLTASDNVSNGNWHNADFNINVSGGGSSPSGIYYLYGIEDGNVQEKINDKKVSVNEETNSKEYKFIACNNVGTCSDVSNYNVKLDKTKPIITDFYNNNTDTTSIVTSAILTGTATDTGSKITKYKFTRDEIYNNNGWTNITSSENVSQNVTINSRGIYYFFVQDEAGNYSSKELVVSNVGTLTTKVVNIKDSSSRKVTQNLNLSGLMDVLKIETNNGRITYKAWMGTTLTFTVDGGNSHHVTTTNSYPSYTNAVSYMAIFHDGGTKCSCKKGYTLSGNKCIGKITGKLTNKQRQTWKCISGIWAPGQTLGNSTMNCGDKDGNGEPEIKVIDNYIEYIQTEYGKYEYVNCDPYITNFKCTGTSQRTFSRNCYADCKNPDTTATCESDRYYYCPTNNATLSGQYCYYCTKGTLQSNKRCKYYDTTTRYLYDYTVTIYYYK